MRVQMWTWGIGVVVAAASFASPAAAEDAGRCSPKMLVGSWIFATEVGQFPAFGGDLTALGTMDVDRHGNLTGSFDVTVAESDFYAGVPYWGTISIDEDCTGVVEFETGAGSTRRDTIALVSRTEMWGMSQFPENLWTYRARKLPGRRGHH